MTPTIWRRLLVPGGVRLGKLHHMFQAAILEILSAPDHEDYDHLLEWVGCPFDPTDFDLVVANVALQQVR